MVYLIIVVNCRVDEQCKQCQAKVGVSEKLHIYILYKKAARSLLMKLTTILFCSLFSYRKNYHVLLRRFINKRRSKRHTKLLRKKIRYVYDLYTTPQCLRKICLFVNASIYVCKSKSVSVLICNSGVCPVNRAL